MPTTASTAPKGCNCIISTAPWPGSASRWPIRTGASGLAPRCRKDVVEEALFNRRRDLFAELSVVFMDTTSLSFEARAAPNSGRRGHSKDFRPDLNQMIVGLAMDQDGLTAVLRDVARQHRPM